MLRRWAPFCYAGNNSSWLSPLELTANESGSTSMQRIKTSRVWHLIRNIATFNRDNVTTTMPSLHNILISRRNSFQYHAVHCWLSMIWLLLKIIDCEKKRGKNRLIGSRSTIVQYMYLQMDSLKESQCQQCRYKATDLLSVNQYLDS